MHPEDAVTDCDHPVLQRGFFKIRDAVQASGHPVARIQHVARDLRLHGIHVVHEGRRADHAPEENENGNSEDD
jgi:nicotinamidase-related amidase